MHGAPTVRIASTITPSLQQSHVISVRLFVLRDAAWVAAECCVTVCRRSAVYQQYTLHGPRHIEFVAASDQSAKVAQQRPTPASYDILHVVKWTEYISFTKRF